jgi:hypothetical protein
MTMIDTPASMQRTFDDVDAPEDAVKSPEIAQEPTEDVAEVTEPELPIPDKPGGWKQVADVEQRLRLFAAQKSADILREYGGSGVFSSGSTKSVNPVDVITLAQWIVYGTHDQ